LIEQEDEWIPIADATTVGYKRILRVEPVTTSKVKLEIIDATNIPAISNFGLYLAGK
jgi:alpha-L-fucosidase